MKFVIVPGAQIGRIPLLPREFQAIDPREEIEALLEPVGIDLHMPEVGNVKYRLAHLLPPLATRDGAAHIRTPYKGGPAPIWTFYCMHYAAGQKHTQWEIARERRDFKGIRARALDSDLRSDVYMMVKSGGPA